MTGQLRELRVSGSARYDAAFTPLEHFTKEQDTLALYHFDEGQGTVLKDSSGNGYHGEIVGAKWVKVDGSPISPPPAAKTPAASPFTDADVRRIAALPAAEQVEEVRKDLMRRNPDFDGKIETKIEGGVVTEFRIVTDQVTDIAPIRIFKALRVLSLTGTYADKPNGLLEDLTPLKGMNLTHLTHVDLHHTKVGDAGMVHFKDCRNLQSLDLGQTKITDAGLANFKGCQDLEALGLGLTGVGDAGMEYFKDRPKLKKLGLYGTEVGDAGLANFKVCKNLVILDLNLTRVTDAGLANFKDCKNLTLVALFSTDVGDAGLAYFQNSKKIDWLYLNDTKVSDAGLKSLADKKSLTRLWLDRTQVTDAGIVHLQGLTNLVNLRLLGTELTASGSATLQKALPKCRVDWSAAAGPDRRAAEWALRTISGATVRVNNQAEDIRTAADLPKEPFLLTSVVLSGVHVNGVGFANFKGCKNLTSLNIGGTRAGDAGLLYFKEMPLKVLWIHNTNISDLTPLQGMSLVDIRLSPKNITKGLDILRDMKSLKTIGIDENRFWPAAEFWERYGKGEFK
jgi:Leucine-rich repeat (LRR) protein